VEEKLSGRSTATKVIGWFAGLTFGAAIIQVIIFRGQLNVMQGQLEEMALDQRPWIHFDGLPKIVGPLEMSSPRVASLDIAFAITNTGKNPARRVNINYGLIPGEFFGNYLFYQAKVCADALAPKEAGAIDTEYTLFPGQQLAITRTVVMVGLDKMYVPDNQRRIRVAPALVGCITYQFLSNDDPHQTGFICEIWPKGHSRDNERGFELSWDEAIQAADLYVRDSPVGNGPAN